MITFRITFVVCLFAQTNYANHVCRKTRMFISSLYSGKRQFVMDNEFPYAFSPEILHKVIWSADELTPEEYHRCIEREYSTKDYDIVVFVNPVHRKSVRGVHHGHALLRKKLSA